MGSIPGYVIPKTFKMVPEATLLGPTLKNCWFAVLLPTHKNWPYPKNFMAMLGKIFFFNQKT